MKTFAEIVAEEDARCEALAKAETAKFLAEYESLTPEQKQKRHDDYAAKAAEFFIDEPDESDEADER